MLRQEGIKGLWHKFRRRGLKGASLFMWTKLRYQLCSAFERAWDKKHGVDTSGQIDLDKLVVVGDNKTLGHSVVSTSPRMFKYLSRYFSEGAESHTFIDVGCGKGRVVLLASQLGFGRVIGIEFSPLVAETARENIARFRGTRQARDVCSIVTEDASKYALPSGPLVLFLMNPFEPELARSFIANVLEAFDRNKEPIRICLTGSVPDSVNGTAKLLEASNRVRRRHAGSSPYFADTYLPYVYWVFDVV